MLHGYESERLAVDQIDEPARCGDDDMGRALQRGDLARGSLLFTYLFLIMASYIVARVSRDVASPGTVQGPPMDQSGLLTLEQLTQELQQAALREPMRRPAATPVTASTSSAATSPDVPLEADRQTLATLERWLTAIDGFRADQRS